MALVDPYSPCPCGSGQKYKWCCQKVEAYAERAQRLVDSGQLEAALKPLDEGLAKAAANPWLSTRKALVLLQLNQFDAAKVTLRALVQAHPENLVGSILMTRLVLETEGPTAGVAHLQQALSARPAANRGELSSLASLVGSALGQGGFFAAALKHLELAGQLAAAELKQSASVIRSLKMNPAISAWEKNPYGLLPAPENATPAHREAFDKAIGWASEGLWSSAASAFELLSAGSSASAIADRNRGLCCLWLADHEGAVAALRRFIARAGSTAESVDIEALCQKIERPAPRDLVEFVHLSWPIRNRDGLLAALGANKYFAAGSDRPVDSNDSTSAEVIRFFLLDRPQILAKEGLTPAEIPVVLGEMLISSDSVILETYDDGRLDRLTDRFTAAAGATIPPAHPRTKIISKEQRHLLKLSWRWHLPEGLAEEEAERLNDLQIAAIIRDVWLDTPNPALRWRTPMQAAKIADLATALRAAVLQLQLTDETWVGQVDWTGFRAKLELPAEPEPQLDQVKIDDLPLSRLALIPVEPLDDDRVLALYRRGREWGIRMVANRAAQRIDAQPSLMAKGMIEPIALYGELALDAAGRNNRKQAQSWFERGRAAEPSAKRSANAVGWEMIGLQIQMVLDGPEVWVKSLAVILERYRGNQEATSAVFLRLINLGLVQVVADPNRPEQVALDTRTLEYYLEQFGPRVTTSTGELGVAAARDEIWTPDSGRGGGSSAIWTPGAAAAPAAGAGKSPIIITGK
jgi:tetratricopeptide (TPR) repeat protein